MPHVVSADEFASLREFCSAVGVLGWAGLSWARQGKIRSGGKGRERGAGRMLGSGLGDWEIRFCDPVGDAWCWKSGAEILVVASSKSYIQNYFGERAAMLSLLEERGIHS